MLSFYDYLHNNSEARNQKLRDLEQLGQEKQNTESKITELTANRDRVEIELSRLDRVKEGATTKTEQLRNQLRSVEKDIQSLNQQKTDRLKAYGHNMPDVIRDVRQLEQQGRWRGRMPIGPFGEIIYTFALSYHSIDT